MSYSNDRGKQATAWRASRPAPGSRSRILIYEDGKVNWEDAEADDPIPEL